VGDVVNLVEIEARDLSGQCLFKGLADTVCQHLTVGKGEIGRAGHGVKILLPFLGFKGRAYQLAVGKLDAVVAHCLLKTGDIILADLVAEAARAAMDLHYRLVGEQSQTLGHGLIKNLGNPVDLNEVVARAESANLVTATLPCLMRNVLRVGAWHAAKLLRVLQILHAGVAVLFCPARTFHQHLIQFGVLQLDFTMDSNSAGTVPIENRGQLSEEWRDRLH